MFSFRSPRKIVFGRGSIELLPELLDQLGIRGTAMLVTGRSFARRSGYLDKIKSLLTSSGSKVVVFDRVEPNPSIETVEAGGSLAREQGVEFVIGFGGGSAMDAAKGISVLAAHGGRLEDYFYPAEVKPPILPIIAIPTTCGTGSEVTKYGVYSVGLKKKVIASEEIVPTISILDSNVMKYLPNDITAHTSMDALSHALEAYYHVKSSELSDLYAVESIRMIFENFEKGVKGDFDSKERLFYASMLAGFAINLAGTVVVHGLGYYLTQKFGIPHGLANALFLTQFIEYIAENVPERTVSLGKALGIGADDPSEIARGLVQKIDALKSSAGLPMNLKEAGVPESELDKIVEEASSYKRNLENCLKPPLTSDLKTIVKKAFG